jgi:hypothetical protein
MTPEELDELKYWHQDKERYPSEVERLGRGLDALPSEKNLLEKQFIERGVAPAVEIERLRAWLDFAEELIDVHFFGNRVGDTEAAGLCE